MVYNPNIPLPADLLSVSQPQIKANFGQANTIFGINHRPFSPVDGLEGKHTIVEMVNQAGDPAGAVNQGTLYTKTATTGSNLYYKDDNSNFWQITAVRDANRATFGLANNSWTFLPGPLLVKYGYIVAVPANVFHTYTLAGPAFSAQPFGVSLTIASTQINNSGIAIWKDTTFTSIDINISNGNTPRDVSYIIIGPG